MATAIEQAVVELQIIIREFNRRLAGLERRMGVEQDPTLPVPRRPGVMTPLPIQERRTPMVSHTAQGPSVPYDFAGGQTATLEPPEDPRGHSVANEPEAIEAGDSPAMEEITEKIAEAFIGDSGEMIPEEPVAAPAPERTIPVQPPREPPAPPPPQLRVMQFFQSLPEKPQGPGIETTLGRVVTSWAGALTVLAGVIFFLKYAFEGGLSFLSPQVRVALALGAGVVMGSVGQWFHFQKMRALSLAMTGAGLAILMATVLAAHVAFDPPVLSQASAFFIVPALALLGIVLAIFNCSEILAILSLLGVYVSPYVLQTSMDQSLPLLIYLLAVTVGALGLVSLKPAWESMRIIAFAAVWVWLLGWANNPVAAGHPVLGLAFISLLFLLFLAEMCLYLLDCLGRDPAQDAPMTALARHAEAFVTVFSYANTAMTMAAAAALFHTAGMQGLWGFTLALAAAMVGLACVFPSKTFHLSATIQAIVLVLLAAPLLFEKNGSIFAYALLAVGFGVYANRANSQFGRVWMGILFTLAAVRLFAFDAFDPDLTWVFFSYAGGALSAWSIIGWSLALVALLLAWLSRPSRELREDGTTLFRGAPWAAIGGIIAASVMVVVVNFHTLSPYGPCTLAAIVWAFAMIRVARVPAFADVSAELETLASLLLLMIFAKWLCFDGVAREAAHPPAAMPPLFNAFTLNALLLGAAIFLLRPARQTTERGRRLAAWWLFAVGFAWVNLQAIRAVDYFMPHSVMGLGSPDLVKNISLTAVWAITAAVMIPLGFMRKSPSIRYVALTLFALTLAKILFLDMASADTALRILSFLVTGLLLFVVSYLYHRAPQRVDAAANA